MKSEQDYQELERAYNSSEKFRTFYKYFAMFLFFAFFMPQVLSRIGELVQSKSSITLPVTLFTGVSGNLKIRTVNYETVGNESITKEKILNGIQYAKLELWPTIGCAKPVLVYLDDNHNVNRLSVDEAKIIE